jgi:hypothetical protein
MMSRDDLKACNNCGCDQIQYREEEGQYLPFYRYCRNCLAQGPEAATYEDAGLLWNKLNTHPGDSAIEAAAIMRIAHKHMMTFGDHFYSIMVEEADALEEN